VARHIDRFSAWYTPSIVGLALLVMAIPPLLGADDGMAWVYKGLALLLIGCPCALVLATPAAMTSAIAAGTRQGLLVKGGAALEALARIKTVAFDKTGTLTTGLPRVTAIEPLAAGIDDERLLTLAAAVEQGSSHPIAEAILAAASRRGLAIPTACDASTIPGQGARAMVEGRPVTVGSPSYVATLIELPGDMAARIATLESAGDTVVAVVDGDRIIGVIGVRDTPRDDAATAISDLAELGVRRVMLTGDNPRAAAAVGDALGIDIRAGLLPGDKLDEITALKGRGPTAMVGDGINDAPALAAADVGIAMGGATDVALDTADAALLRRRVADVPRLLRLARATMTNVRQNIVAALGLKAVFLITTLLGVTGLWMAVLADTGATVLVTLNALRLLGWRDRTER
jgi:Cd2+/Zn2+-exporting ATPase